MGETTTISSTGQAGSLTKIRTSSSTIAQQAYEAAVDRFCSTLTHDDRKRLLARDANGIDEIHAVLDACYTKYRDKKDGQKVRKCIRNLISKIHHYGNILDVFVQHHPEYTSLVWGAFKFLLVGAQNHAAAFALLAKALSRIADALPRIELYSTLYPTDRMKTAIEELYAYLLKFLIRAVDWFQENPFQHILHSITRPPELRYNDLLEDIDHHSRRVDHLAVSGSQAELRAVHIELAHIKKLIVEHQAINSSAAIDTNQRVTDIQFSNIISSMSASALGDHMKTYQNLLLMAKRRKRSEEQPIGALRTSKVLMAWSNSMASEMAAIKGSFRSRLAIRYFCIEVVEQLRQANVTTLWAFRDLTDTSADTIPSKTQVSSVDILKHLTLQALQAGKSFADEKSLSLTSSQCHTATTPQEWFQIFEAVVSQLKGSIFVIVDLQALHNSSLAAEGFVWSNAILEFFSSLSKRGAGALVKVLLVGYGPAMSVHVASHDLAGKTVAVKSPGAAKRQTPTRKRGGPLKLRQSRPKII